MSQFDQWQRPQKARYRGLAGWMVEKGVATSGSQANYILIFTALIILVVSFFLFARAGNSEEDRTREYNPAIHNNSDERNLR